MINNANGHTVCVCVNARERDGIYVMNTKIEEYVSRM